MSSHIQQIGHGIDQAFQCAGKGLDKLEQVRSRHQLAREQVGQAMGFLGLALAHLEGMEGVAGVAGELNASALVLGAAHGDFESASTHMAYASTGSQDSHLITARVALRAAENNSRTIDSTVVHRPVYAPFQEEVVVLGEMVKSILCRANRLQEDVGGLDERIVDGTRACVAEAAAQATVYMAEKGVPVTFTALSE